jgi:hypothetical protein
LNDNQVRMHELTAHEIRELLGIDHDYELIVVGGHEHEVPQNAIVLQFRKRSCDLPRRN